MRREYVYRLDVVVPEECRWPNQPSGEQIDAAVKLGMMDSRDEWGEGFSLPSWRRMLSGSSARRKANILRALGCTVTIERSAPISWPGVVDPKPEATK